MSSCIRLRAICGAMPLQMAFLFLLLGPGLLFQPALLRAQDIVVDQLTTPDLANATVLDILQAPDGMIWMGTRAGLSSYDGATVRNYTMDEGLAPDEVRALCLDRSGQLWTGHFGGGISRYDGEHFDSIHHCPQVGSYIITDIIRDPHDRMWFTTAGAGVLRLENPEAALEDLVFTQYKGEDLSDLVFNASMDDSGQLYFITDLGIMLYLDDEDRFEMHRIRDLPRFNQNTSILVDSRGKTWVGQYHGGLYCFDPKMDTLQMYDLVEMGLESNWVSSLFEDRLGHIWVGTFDGGTVRLSPNGRITLFDRRSGVPARSIRCMMQDREGNMLMGSDNSGLIVYKGHHFISYGEKALGEASMVSSLYNASDGAIWMGKDEGVAILRRYRGDQRFFTLGEGDLREVNFIREDSRGAMILGVRDGVYTYLAGDRIRSIPSLSPRGGDTRLTALEIDRDDLLFVGYLEELRVYDLRQEKELFSSWFTHFHGQEITLIHRDSREQIWVGTKLGGISLIQKQAVDGRDTLLVQQQVFGDGFTPLAMAEDQDGSLWMGTNARGALRIDPDRLEILDTLNRADRMIENHVNMVQVDLYNNIYLGGNKSLSVLFRQTGEVYNYSESSGFRGSRTLPRSSTIDGQGKLWFGTPEGAICFDPIRRPFGTPEYESRITGARVHKKYYPPEAGDGSLKLPYRRNMIDISFATVSLDRDLLAYRYVLEGLKNAELSEETKLTEVRYPSLPAGHYRFRLETRNRDGSWNRDSASFSFMIRPPFLLRWYSIIAWILILAGSFMAFSAIRERKLRKENIALESKVEERTATVVAQKEELAQKNKDITDSIHYASRIQLAILPENLPYPESFVLFKPKDIVSGDFYWFTEVDGVEFFTAADCTGHGVPGAFMSIVGHNALTRIVRELGIYRPSDILSELNKQVVNTLQHRSQFGEVYDGMDLALVAYHRKEGYLEYAGAFNPLYLIRGGELIEYKADKRAIGHANFNPEAEFTNHRIALQQGDMIYLFSDGYADQFGGELMKKFKYNKLKKLLLEIHGDKTEIQRSVLNETIEKWRGDLEQLDDILVLGRRF